MTMMTKKMPMRPGKKSTEENREELLICQSSGDSGAFLKLQIYSEKIKNMAHNLYKKIYN